MTSGGVSTAVRDCDVLVVGSGCAGLVAALAAAEAGADVIVVERSAVLGGTSSVSGGSIWVPGNRWAEGHAASHEAAWEYVSSEAGPLLDEDVARAYVDGAAATLEWIETASPVRFLPVPYPDYRPWVAGAAHDGRTVQPDLFDSRILGETAAHVRRRSPHLPVLLSETLGGVDFSAGDVATVDEATIRARTEQGLWARGLALVGGLIAGCLANGVTFVLNARVRALSTEDRVTGAVVEHAGQATSVRAARGVVLASGGFESEADLTRRFLGVPAVTTVAPPGNVGDGLRMAMSVGADLSGLSGAWWTPLLARPGEMEDDAPLRRLSQYERSRPGCIMVDASGRRFVNEAANYHDVGTVMTAYDPVTSGYPRLRAWLIFDGRCRASYPMAGISPTEGDPSWLVSAETVEELAEACGIDPDGLATEVATFNDDVRLGRDTRFGRGTSVFDRFIGDQRLDGAAATLGVLDQPPYYALPVTCGVLGTNGGPRIDPAGRVRSVAGGVVRGLYAAGNVTASALGRLYAGAGATLGPAAVFGRAAGLAAVQDEHTAASPPRRTESV